MTLLKSQDKSEKATSKDDLCAGQNDVKVSQMRVVTIFATFASRIEILERILSNSKCYLYFLGNQCRLKEDHPPLKT